MENRKRGGKRPGAGRPIGALSKQTLERNAVKAALEQRILQKADELHNAQYALAVGSLCIFRVEQDGKKKKHILVTDTDEIKEVLDTNEGTSGKVGESYYIVSTQQPDNKAIDSMLDRVFGKAPQTIEINHNETVDKILPIIRACFAYLETEGSIEDKKRELIRMLLGDKGVDIDKIAAELGVVDGELIEMKLLN